MILGSNIFFSLCSLYLIFTYVITVLHSVHLLVVWRLECSITNRSLLFTLHLFYRYIFFFFFILTCTIFVKSHTCMFIALYTIKICNSYPYWGTCITLSRVYKLFVELIAARYLEDSRIWRRLTKINCVPNLICIVYR